MRQGGMLGPVLALLPLLHAAHIGHLHSNDPQQPEGDEWARATTSSPGCALDPALVDEIRGYQATVDQIINYVVSGAFRGVAYDTLAELVDTFGPRMTGSAELEAAIDWVLQKSIAEGLENVHGEQVNVTHWVRNEESATLVLPRQKKLNMMGVGGSVATPLEGITAPVLVVRDFQELDDNAALVPGKIVVYNQEYVTYSDTSEYRAIGPMRAAEKGAVAALVRSITPFSIDSPHTGQTYFSNESIAIPAACITVEDAAMLQRMQNKGEQLQVRLVMNAQMLPDTVSRNTVVELLGATKPEEVVVVSGHLDSWDGGEGAMDDGGGSVISWLAPLVLQRIALRPRRTVRAVLFTDEEQKGSGAKAYYESHGADKAQYQLMMESDQGTFSPLGIGFTGTEEATCIMQEVLGLMGLINATQLFIGGDGADLYFWVRDGVPMGSPTTEDDKYFWFHHSRGDTMTVYEPDMLDRCLALWTAVSYVTADMSARLPHANVTRSNVFEDL